MSEKKRMIISIDKPLHDEAILISALEKIKISKLFRKALTLYFNITKDVGAEEAFKTALMDEVAEIVRSKLNEWNEEKLQAFYKVLDSLKYKIQNSPIPDTHLNFLKKILLENLNLIEEKLNEKK